MIKKILFGLLALIILALCIIFFYVADRVDANFNTTSLEKPYKYSNQADNIFSSLEFVADLHCDALMWQRNLNLEHDWGHVDIPRLQQGNVAFQAFTMVTKSPDGLNFDNNNSSTDRITKLYMGQGKPFYTWFSLMGRATHQCRQLNGCDRSNEYFHVIGNKKEFQDFLNLRKKNKKHVASFLGAEGGHCLEGNIENVEKLYNMGVRMLGPTHFFDNELGGSAHGIEKGGLTDFGKDVIKKMDELNMIIDIAHSSDQIINDIIKLTNSPIISSHTGVDGTCDSPRNLSDKQLRAIANSDGLVGIAFFNEAVCGANIPNIVKAMRYTINLIGAEYVALGSDFDGTVDVPFDATGFPLLVDEMLRQNFTEKEIRMIMGENVKRFLLKNLPSS